MTNAILVVPDEKSQEHFLPKANFTDDKGQVHHALVMEKKIPLRDLFKIDKFWIKAVHIHRIYFQVDQILIEYPTLTKKMKSAEGLTPVINTLKLDNGDTSAEIMTMVTLTDGTGNDIARIFTLKFDAEDKTVGCFANQNDGKSWQPVGFEVSFEV